VYSVTCVEAWLLPAVARGRSLKSGRPLAPALDRASTDAHVAGGLANPDALGLGHQEGTRERSGASAVQQKTLRLEVAGLNTATLVGGFHLEPRLGRPLS